MDMKSVVRALLLLALLGGAVLVGTRVIGGIGSRAAAAI